MPLFQGARLEDGRYLGLTVREVTALPHVDVFGTDTGRMGEIFGSLLGDLARLCGESAALELLWLSQPVSGQKFPTRARLFLLLRSCPPRHSRQSGRWTLSCPPWRRCSPRRAAPCPGERR